MKASLKLAALTFALLLVPSLARAQEDDHVQMRRQVIGEAVMSENGKIRQAIKDLQDDGILEKMIRGEFLPGESQATEKTDAALAVLDQEGFWEQGSAEARASMSFPGAEFLGLGGDTKEEASGDTSSNAGKSSDSASGEFSEDEKKKLAEIATAHFAKQFPAWPRIHVTGMWQDGEEKVVRFMPENKMGVIMFMASYKVWIDGSGAVKKMK